MSDAIKCYKLVIHGLIDSINFKRAQYCAQKMVTEFPNVFKTPEIFAMFEFEWEEFIEKQKKELVSNKETKLHCWNLDNKNDECYMLNFKKIMRGEMWIYDKNELVFINDKMIGSYDDLLYWADYNHFYENNLPNALFSALVEEDYREELIKRNHDFIYMYISIGDEPSGFLLIELFNEILPKTCNNFTTLCIGNNSMVCEPQTKFTYEKSCFHRIVPNGWIQGGDVVYGHGDGGKSIYGGEFEDENFSIPFNKRGILGMANHGPHTNASQFFITLVETSWMNNKYVAFGQLLEGTDLLQILEEQETYNERPINPIRITRCEAFDVQESISYTPPPGLNHSVTDVSQDVLEDLLDAPDVPQDISQDELEDVLEDVPDAPEDEPDAPENESDAPEDLPDALEAQEDVPDAPEDVPDAPEESD